MKQQYTGPYTFDVATRTITLAGIEVPQERLALIVNSTVGFIYHNLEHEPTAQVTISGGNTVIVFPQYKDCETHRDSDALSIFYDDGVDLGQLIKDESDETQTLLQNEFDETQTAISDFRTEAKAESDETQTLLQNKFDETQAAIVSTTGGILSAVGYDAIDSFNGDYAIYQGGLDKGGVINIVGGVITVVTPGSGYSAGFANSVGGTRFVVEIDPSAFRMKVKAEFDQTQTLLQTEFDETQTAISDFRTEVKAESDETQSLLNAEFNETQTAISDFRTEVKAESDATQTLLQTEFDETQTAIADFRTEVKSESDATQTLLQNEFDETQTAISGFRTEVKAESDATQALLNLKLAGLINGFLGVEHLVKYSSENGYDIEIVPATYDGVNRNTGYSPSQIVFSKGGGVSMTIFLHYDNEGHLILVTSQYWTPSLLDTRAIWLDASDLTSIVTSGQYVTQWNSQLDSTWSARPFDNPPTTDSRPKSGVATINDLNAISFDAVDDDLLTYKNGIRRALADVDQGAQYSKEAVFIVARRNAPSSSRWLSAGVSGNRNFGTFFPGLGVNRMILDIGPNRVDYYYPAAFPAVGLFSFFVDSTAPSSELFFNGTRVSLDTTPFDMFAGRQDGVGGTTTGPGSGDDFGEVLVLREVPDRTTRQKIEGYLAHKWGLVSELPAGHPHKFAPPGV